jgi:D-alanyl-D-alanine carboxypeptidase/D-alanyl-D-alanine-endopeptidase (penicillin-binding protein 4)
MGIERKGWRSQALACVLACASWASPAGAVDLGERLDAVLGARALRGARIAALVVGDAGQVLYERDPDRPLIPASNLKVLTAIAALRALGPTHRFVTTLLSEAVPGEDGALQTLWVRGSGDPSLTSEEYWRLAADLRRAGVTRVRGDLVLDDDAFDDRRWHPSWGPTGVRAYHAPVGALTANYGAFSVTVTPGAAPGDPLRAVVDPPVSYLSLVVRGQTGSPRSRSTLVVDRQAGADGERVLVSGAMPAGRDAKTLHRSVLDPTRYAGAVLHAQLESLGISVTGQVRVGSVPANAVPVLEFEGPPLSDVVWLFMKYSNNQIGEALVKALAARAGDAPGNWSAGSAAARAELGAMGLPLEGLVLVDGSGLSYENRVSPRLLVAALRAASEDFAFGPEFQAALPIASTDGTLEERTEGTPGRVRAKTGLLTRVTGLSGFALRGSGERVIFSILVNGFRGGAEDAMDAVDRFAEALASGVVQERVGLAP